MTDKLYKRMLITCVFALIVCVLLKIFGADWFNLDTNILLLQKADNIIMNNNILSFVFTLLFKTINAILVFSLIIKDINFALKKSYILVICMIVAMLLNQINTNISFVFDTIYLYFITLFFKKIKFKEYIIIVFANILYQLISLFIRNMSMIPQTYIFIEYTLLSLDYYIMLIITYLYLKKGDNTICGAVVQCGFFLRKKLWKKHTENLSPSLSSKEANK